VGTHSFCSCPAGVNDYIGTPAMESSVYQFKIDVTEKDVDRNRHVNNVVYIQWMQDAAIAHARASGCTKASQAVGATWVVRTHHIEYLAPLFAGDKVTVLTWPANFQRVRSTRKYKFLRANDGAVIARAETDWVFVNAKTGRPRSIPEEVRQTLPVVSENMEP